MLDHLFVGEPSGATAIEGSVEHVTFYNPATGFSVVKLRVRGRREPVAVVGTLPAVQPGEWLDLAGSWELDGVHGARFRPQRVEVRPPSALGDIARYLGSGLIRQLGPVLAKRIVEAFGERTLEVLDREPERVRRVPGIGPLRGQAIAAAWVEHRALRAVAGFLAEHGLDTRFAPRLVGAYGREAPRVLAANPYRLVAEVPGLGFAAADRLGQALGVRQTAPGRLQAAVHGALLRAAEAGHTRLRRPELVRQGAQLAGVEEGLVEGAVTQLLTGGVIAGDGQVRVAGPAHLLPVRPSHDGLRSDPQPGERRGGDLRAGTAAPAGRDGAGGASSGTGESRGAGRVRLYEPPPAPAPEIAPEVGREREGDAEGEGSAVDPALGLGGLVAAEEALADRLLELAARRVPAAPERVAAWLDADAGARALSDEQRAAVRGAAGLGLFVLTGGPGVGKTTTLRVLVRLLRALGRSVALAAPTGKAAQRLAEVVGLEGVEARTVHRLLGAGPEGFRHGARSPLAESAVVVDEASMLDTRLARALATAVGPEAQLLLVGDADQLPSVGPGQVLRDLLASGRVPAARLSTVFRQAAQSRIVRAAHRIREGLVPELAPAADLQRGVDCVFVPVPAPRVAEVAVPWAAERLPRTLGLSPGDVQVLAPLNRVCQAVNGALQARLNPPAGQPERPHGALALRTGDRVIQTRNNYGLGVFNGDTGVVTAVAPDGATVDFGDGRAVAYAPADLLDLEHAYCLTVHRAQGSEWPGVVLLASSAYGPMLSRNLLYTALTRARRAVVILGDEEALVRAVAETRDQARSTGLAGLLQGAPLERGQGPPAARSGPPRELSPSRGEP